MKNQIFVTGILPGKIKTLDVKPDDTVYDLMSQIEDLTGIPPIMQRLRLINKYNYLLHDAPGTLADNQLVVKPYSANLALNVVLSTFLGNNVAWDRLQRKTLQSLGFAVPDEDVYDESVLRGPDGYPGQRLMFVTVVDHIRMDGGDRNLVLVVVAGNTVASVKEQVKRTRRYPVAMQLFKIVSDDAGSPGKERRMDKLDATMADYDVKNYSIINLYMDMEFALQADREERGKFDKAKEIDVPQ